MGYNYIDTSYLAHHGVKGMKWGVRHDRKHSGKHISRNKKRNKMTREQKVAAGKKIAVGIAATTTVAAAAYYVHKNPEKIGKVISHVKNVNMRDIGRKAVSKGKAYATKTMKNAVKGFKDGFNEGMRDAPKKFGKVLATGIVLNAAKRGLDKAVGTEESTRIFQANDNKKIGKFWKVSSDDQYDNKKRYFI